MIPKLVHQTCRDASALRPELKASIEALKRLNPGWTHCLYDDAQVWAYLKQHLDADSFALARRIELPGYGAALADLFRYVLCFNEGGVYLDIKSTATRALDEVLKPDDAYLISQWRNRARGESRLGTDLRRAAQLAGRRVPAMARRVRAASPLSGRRDLGGAAEPS